MVVDQALRRLAGLVEALSGMFDFNRAPFFQSFVEVRVEGTQRRVRLILHGVGGPLRWRDLQSSGTVWPAGAGRTIRRNDHPDDAGLRSAAPTRLGRSTDSQRALRRSGYP